MTAECKLQAVLLGILYEHWVASNASNLSSWSALTIWHTAHRCETVASLFLKAVVKICWRITEESHRRDGVHSVRQRLDDQFITNQSSSVTGLKRAAEEERLGELISDFPSLPNSNRESKQITPTYAVGDLCALFFFDLHIMALQSFCLCVCCTLLITLEMLNGAANPKQNNHSSCMRLPLVCSLNLGFDFRFTKILFGIVKSVGMVLFN